MSGFLRRGWTWALGRAFAVATRLDAVWGEALRAGRLVDECRYLDTAKCYLQKRAGPRVQLPCDGYFEARDVRFGDKGWRRAAVESRLSEHVCGELQREADGSRRPISWDDWKLERRWR